MRGEVKGINVLSKELKKGPNGPRSFKYDCKSCEQTRNIAAYCNPYTLYIGQI